MTHPACQHIPIRKGRLSSCSESQDCQSQGTRPSVWHPSLKGPLPCISSGSSSFPTSWCHLWGSQKLSWSPSGYNSKCQHNGTIGAGGEQSLHTATRAGTCDTFGRWGDGWALCTSRAELNPSRELPHRSAGPLVSPATRCHSWAVSPTLLKWMKRGLSLNRRPQGTTKDTQRHNNDRNLNRRQLSKCFQHKHLQPQESWCLRYQFHKIVWYVL